jgi:predicted AAA+ superfamily ATPase
VVMQVVRHYYASGKAKPLWYWRRSQGAEVDLLIEEGGRFVAIECRYAANIDRRDLKGLKELAREYGDDALTRTYVASRTAKSYPVADSIDAVPGSFIDMYLR